MSRPCPECGSDDVTVIGKTIVEIGPVNNTGTLANKPTPRYKEVEADQVECEECGHMGTYLIDDRHPRR